MKILVINPNTSTFVTEAVAASARSMAAPGTEIVAVTGRYGPAIVSGRSEDALAAAEAMRLAAENDAGCDAIILAISFDSGLRALREISKVPVIGMSEAAMLSACMVGGKFAMVTFGNRAISIYVELCRSYGLETRLSNVLSLPPLTSEEQMNPSLIVPNIARIVQKTVENDRTEAVVLSGAIFAGISDEVSVHVEVPVLNGVREAVGMAEMLVRLKPAKARSGSYQSPDAKKIEWPDANLVARYANL
jgi:allantoin racemase